MPVCQLNKGLMVLIAFCQLDTNLDISGRRDSQILLEVLPLSNCSVDKTVEHFLD